MRFIGWVLLLLAGAAGATPLPQVTPGPVTVTMVAGDRAAVDALAQSQATAPQLLARGAARIFVAQQNGRSTVFAVVGDTVLPLVAIEGEELHAHLSASVDRFFKRRDLLDAQVVTTVGGSGRVVSRVRHFVLGTTPAQIACTFDGDRQTDEIKSAFYTNVVIARVSATPLTFETTTMKGGHDKDIFFDGVPQRARYRFGADGRCVKGADEQP